MATDPFNILAGFLDHFGREVEGRELSEPTQEAKAKLEQLARGTLPDAEQAEVWDLLNQNPEWVHWLAQEVKAFAARKV